MTPDGVTYYRIRLDNDGVIVVEGVSGPTASDYYFPSVGDGPLFNVGAVSDIANPAYKVRADSRGLISEGVTLSGWLVRRAPIVTSYSNVILTGHDGIALTTPDGLHMYRIRVDTDGAIISEGIS